MMINTPTSHSNLEEIIDESIKSFAIDIIKSDNLNFNSKQIDILLETSYLLTKLSSINAELQSVENEIISIQKSDHTKENRFNKMLKEEINTLNWTLQKIKNF